MTFKNPNWKKVMNNANEVLIRSEVIKSFPFPVKGVVKELSKIQCCSYAKARDKFNLDISEFGSESAIIMEFHGRRILFYNDNKPKTHIRFSILHEFGHEVNNHKLSYDDDKSYGIKEIETNFFAAQLLMPEQIIREFQIRGVTITERFLIDTFEVSREAAQKRLKTLRKINWERRTSEERHFDEGIVLKYSAFLESVKPSTLHNLDWFENEYDLENQRNNWR